MTQMTNTSDMEHGFLFYISSVDYIPDVYSHATFHTAQPKPTPDEQLIFTTPASPLSSQHTWQNLFYATFALTILLLAAWWTMTSVIQLLLYRLQGVSNFDFVQALIRGT